MSKVKDKVRQRPAETGSLIAALAAGLASAGVDLSADQWRMVVAGVGLVAAVVTWWRSR